MSTVLRRCVLSALLYNLAACSAMQPVSVERAMRAETPPGVDYGSLVRVKTLTDRTVEFRVTEITAEGLGGKPGFFAYADMASLEVERPAAEDRAGLAWLWGLVTAAALIALVSSADSVAVCSEGPCGEPQP